MRDKEVDPGLVINTLLEDINAWKGEDILPDEHIQMLGEAESHLLNADKYHKRYLTSKATMDAKKRNRAPQSMIARYRRECQTHSYQRDSSIKQAENILAEIISQIERLAEDMG